MIKVSIDHCKMTVWGSRIFDGIGSFYMILQCMKANSDSSAVLTIDCDTVTVSTDDLDYPGCANEIVELVQYINHIACPEFDPIDAPAIYERYADAGDVAE